MRLLVITQKVDLNDDNLGFFHRWLEEFAQYCESIIVICLQKGEHHLPSNVKVISLGKEKSRSRIKYLWNFYKYIFKYKNDYDGVFVHMNKEYVLLGGLLWRFWGKRIALWYTHKTVSRQLRLAEKLVDKIFTASKESFRLKSKKVEVVGHGIPVEQFAEQKFNIGPEGTTTLPSDTIYLLSVGRISPSKDLETVVRGVAELYKTNNCLISIYGMPITQSDVQYETNLFALANQLRPESKNNFFGVCSQKIIYGEIPHVYQRHHILIHTSRTGSIDKVVLEAMASGRLVISSSEAFADLAKEGLIYAFPAGDYQALAAKIVEIYQSGMLDRIPDQRAIDYVRKNHNLDNLVKKIIYFYAA